MNTTDQDYDLKRQKFVACDKTIDADRCPDDCSKCKYDLSAEDFTYFVMHGVDEP